MILMRLGKLERTNGLTKQQVQIKQSMQQEYIMFTAYNNKAMNSVVSAHIDYICNIYIIG